MIAFERGSRKKAVLMLAGLGLVSLFLALGLFRLEKKNDDESDLPENDPLVSQSRRCRDSRGLPTALGLSFRQSTNRSLVL